MAKMTADNIVKLIKQDPSLKQFINAFYQRLANHNKFREVSATRTELEKKTDAMGRLLTGDETCAAVAIDDEKIYVASNKANHNDDVVSARMISVTVAAGSTMERMELVLTLEFTINDRTFSKDTPPIIYKKTENKKPESFRALFSKANQLSPEKPHVEFTFPFQGGKHAHGIVEYPYPMGFHFTLSTIPGLHIDGELETSQNFKIESPTTYRFYLDPLKRRAEALFHHLGCISVYHLCSKPQTQVDFTTVVNRHRIRVLRQTLGWEAPSWVTKGLGNNLREFAPKPTANRAEKRAWHQRKKNLQALHDFIEVLINDLIEYLNSDAQPVLEAKLAQKIATQQYMRLSKAAKEDIDCYSKYHRGKASPVYVMKIWFEQKLNELNNNRLSGLPSFMNHKKAKIFLERTYGYFIDLFALEGFIAAQAHKFSKIATVLASSGLREYTDNTEQELARHYPFFKRGAEVIIVPDQLADGSHAEMRLFYYLQAYQRLQRGTRLPYFGITMLCCANCHLFLKAHGIDYVDGKRYRAGRHARLYPSWILDEKLQIDCYLKNFFGEAYSLYKDLSPKQKNQAILIIQDLGVLEKKHFNNLRPFGFIHSKIQDTASQYAEDDPLQQRKILDAVIRHYLDIAPKIRHGLFRGKLPRHLRELHTIYHEAKQREYTSEEIQQIIYVASHMGEHHPILIAAKRYQSYPKQSWLDAFTYQQRTPGI